MAKTETSGNCADGHAVVRTDVLIVGAGPVGLALAVELGLRDIDCRLVDKVPEIGHWWTRAMNIDGPRAGGDRWRCACVIERHRIEGTGRRWFPARPARRNGCSTNMRWRKLTRMDSSQANSRSIDRIFRHDPNVRCSDNSIHVCCDFLESRPVMSKTTGEHGLGVGLPLPLIPKERDAR
jgi:hypothetical protein